MIQRQTCQCTLLEKPEHKEANSYTLSTKKVANAQFRQKVLINDPRRPPPLLSPVWNSGQIIYKSFHTVLKKGRNIGKYCLKKEAKAKQKNKINLFGQC